MTTLPVDGATALFLDALTALRPPESLTPSQWAEKHVSIPTGNAIPGPIRFDNAPYQRAVLDAFADRDTRRISLMWGAQVGKTQVMNCAMGYFIAHDPQSQIAMHPTEEDLFTWLDVKFSRMIESSPVLNEAIAAPRSRKGVNNKRLKTYPGGELMFAFAGAPRTMRGRSAPKIWCDEVDGYEVTKEGHPVNLLWQRAATFGDMRLLFESSTPTIRDSSTIEASFLAGDRRRYWVPCPHCGEFIVLKWQHVHYAKDAEDLPDPETAEYSCQECGCEISDGEKVAALRLGEWRAEREFRGHASFHLPELYSAFRTWFDIVESYREKVADDDVQTFVNVSLAETYEETGVEADATQLAARAEAYAAAVPDGVAVLTAGIDAQIDRLEVEVVGWGRGEESWSIDYHVLWGDPLNLDVWDDLTEYLSRTWVHESGAVLGIHAACLDTGGTGGYTTTAYDYIRQRRARRLFGVKGVDGWGRPIAGAPAKRKGPSRGPRIQLFPVGVDEAKLTVMRRLNVPAPGPGYCHFPDGRETEYYDQLTAERLMTKIVKGQRRRRWKLTRDRNEALDCRVYALAALKISRPSIERMLAVMVPAEAPDAPPESADEAPRSAPVTDDASVAGRRVWRPKSRRRRR